MAKEHSLDPQYFLDVLAHLEQADIIAWNERSSAKARAHLDRLVSLVRRAAAKAWAAS